MDDLIPEENDVVQLALKRLPPKEAYDRVWRLRRALQVYTIGLCTFGALANMPQCSVSHQLLPKEEWTKPEDVRRIAKSLSYTAFNVLIGSPISFANHKGDRGRDEGT